MNDRFKQVACIVVLLGFGFVCGRSMGRSSCTDAPSGTDLGSVTLNFAPPSGAGKPVNELVPVGVRTEDGYRPLRDRTDAPVFSVVLFPASGGPPTTYYYQQATP